MGIKSKLLGVIGINQISIATLNQSVQYSELNKLLKENTFNKTSILFNCIDTYTSNSKKGKILMSNYSDESFNEEKEIGIALYWTNKNINNNIKKQLLERGYEFKVI
jgi:hypothetical protein